MTFLDFVILSDNFIRDSGAIALSDSLKRNTTLTELQLGCEFK